MQISGMGGLVKAAADGHFAVDPGTGQQLIMSLSQMRDQVKGMLQKAAALDRKTPLGDLPEAVAISELNRQVAAGDEQSLLHVLRLFEVSLDQAYEAVRAGMANYEQVDSEMRDAYERGLQEQRRQDGTRPA